MAKRALITGVSGQDGAYLAELLSTHGYVVYGHSRRPANRVLDLPVKSISFDLQSEDEWRCTIEKYQLDEIYHLAGVSFVPASWESPVETIKANLEVTANVLESMRSFAKPPRLFFACSSEVFGQTDTFPQNEETPFRPLNPYGVTKAASFDLIRSYRKKYGFFACSGILFNHESPRRDPAFVTRKITKAAAAISMGMQDRLTLGNLDVSRDWGYAGDFVDCMHRMLQSEVANDYVIGTGRLTSLEKVVNIAFKQVGLNWKEWVSVDSRFVRANEPQTLVADSSKALRNLGWHATTHFEDVVKMMVTHDLRLLDCSESRAA